MLSVLVLGTLAASVAGCSESAPSSSAPPTTVGSTTDDLSAVDNPAIVRFLSHATFGAAPSQVDKVRAQGYGAWLKAELDRPFTKHLPYVSEKQPPTNQNNPRANIFPMLDSAWTQMAFANDQVRQRLAFAYSQILVVSLNDAQLARRPAGVANYYDLLGNHSTGNFRNMLEAVTKNPMMGLYLSTLKNQKADAATGRSPDENYAREVMQLFTIGLHQLNPDGTKKLDEGGNPIETYSDSDIVGLARVFTGYSWACVGDAVTSECWKGGASTEVNRDILPMQMYPDRHSPEEAKFLGVRLAGTLTPAQRLDGALDRLVNHHNVPMFIGKQLIQRLVTSNPSPNYVKRVAAAFRTGTFVYNGETPAVTFGAGAYGDLEATAAAVLLDVEATRPNVTEKLDEPILRLMRWARAFDAKPTTGTVLHLVDIGARTNLGQAPLSSPSVFNFFRPGYSPPGGIAALDKVAPEFQGVDEVSVAGYANFMQRTIKNGVPMRDGEGGGAFTSDYAAEVELAGDADALLNRINFLLTGQRMSADTKATIRNAINSITIPTAPPAAIVVAKKNRVRLAVYLAAISTDFLLH